MKCLFAKHLRAHTMSSTNTSTQEQFQNVLNDLDVQSEQPSADEKQPYLAKYQVREKLFGLLEKCIQGSQVPPRSNGSIDLAQVAHTSSGDSKDQMGKVFYRLGVNYFDCEESADAELFLFCALLMLSEQSHELEQCVVPRAAHDAEAGLVLTSKRVLLFSIKRDALTDCLAALAPRNPQYCLIDFIDSFNYFGVIWTNRQEYATALSFFDTCESYYADMRPDHEHSKLVEMQTLTTFYLAQVYGHLKQIHKSAKYSFLTLKRQLTSGLEYDPIQWVRNAIQLSSYFLSQDDFIMCDHCLNAARHLWDDAKPHLQEHLHDPASLDEEDIHNLDANLHLAFSRQHFALLEYSKNWIENWRTHQDKLHKTNTYTKDELFPTEQIKVQPLTELTSQMNFDGVAKCGDFYVITAFPQALQLFKKVKKGFEKALKFYVLDGFVTEHVKTCQQLSSAYTHLIFYESNPVRKIAMHKRRAALLDPILDELNENVYKDTLKVLSFELGQMYSNMHDEYGEMEEQKNLGGMSVETLHNKDNEVMLKAIEYFSRFHKYFESSEGQVEVEEANRPAFIRAHFCLASMYYRIHTQDVEMQRKFLVLSQQEYNLVVHFAEEHKMKEMKVEVDMARDMSSLLPLKLKSLSG